MPTPQERIAAVAGKLDTLAETYSRETDYYRDRMKEEPDNKWVEIFMHSNEERRQAYAAAADLVRRDLLPSGTIDE